MCSTVRLSHEQTVLCYLTSSGKMCITPRLSYKQTVLCYLTSSGKMCSTVRLSYEQTVLCYFTSSGKMCSTVRLSYEQTVLCYLTSSGKMCSTVRLSYGQTVLCYLTLPCKTYAAQWDCPMNKPFSHTCLSQNCIFRNKNHQNPENSMIFWNTSANVLPNLLNKSTYQIFRENHRAVYCASPLLIPCCWECCLLIALDSHQPNHFTTVLWTSEFTQVSPFLSMATKGHFSW